MTHTTPRAISRALVAGGIRPVLRSREGIHLSSGAVTGRVHVYADVDGPRAADRLSADAAEILSVAGYAIDRVDSVSFYAGTC
jgi:hypothetical protein